MTDTGPKKQIDQPSPATRKVADAIAMGLVNGRTVEEIASELETQGWKKADALEFVGKIDSLHKQAQQQRENQKGLRRGLIIHLIMGVIWITMGIAAMFGSSPQRDYTTISVAIIALGLIEAGWSIKQMRRL